MTPEEVLQVKMTQRLNQGLIAAEDAVIAIKALPVAAAEEPRREAVVKLLRQNVLDVGRNSHTDEDGLGARSGGGGQGLQPHSGLRGLVSGADQDPQGVGQREGEGGTAEEESGADTSSGATDVRRQGW